MVIEPRLFGGDGLPLLKGVDVDYKLKLLDSAKLNDDTLQVHYQIVDTMRP